jgi:hypothetical protein
MDDVTSDQRVDRLNAVYNSDAYYSNLHISSLAFIQDQQTG